MKFFETKNIFSKPKRDDILFESIKSFAIALNESKKTKGEMISVYRKGFEKKSYYYLCLLVHFPRERNGVQQNF